MEARRNNSPNDTHQRPKRRRRTEPSSPTPRACGGGLMMCAALVIAACASSWSALVPSRSSPAASVIVPRVVAFAPCITIRFGPRAAPTSGASRDVFKLSAPRGETTSFRRHRVSHQRRHPSVVHPRASRDEQSVDATSRSSFGDDVFDPKTTLSLIGGQSLLIVFASALAVALHTPNYGFGTSTAFTSDAIITGTLYTVPLFALALFLDTVEDSYPPLKDVTLATQRSVLALLGTTRKPILALAVSIALGIAAGVGEEMMFRGVLQTEVTSRFDGVTALAGSSVIFGALHAVTPLYAALATIASVFFGVLYNVSDGNLAVPMVCHGLYDVGALMWAHWVVTGVSEDEREEIMSWVGPMEK